MIHKIHKINRILFKSKQKDKTVNLYWNDNIILNWFNFKIENNYLQSFLAA